MEKITFSVVLKALAIFIVFIFLVGGSLSSSQNDTNFSLENNLTNQTETNVTNFSIPEINRTSVIEEKDISINEMEFFENESNVTGENETGGSFENDSPINDTTEVEISKDKNFTLPIKNDSEIIINETDINISNVTTDDFNLTINDTSNETETNSTNETNETVYERWVGPGDSVSTTVYIEAGNNLVASIKDDKTSFYIQDHLGSNRKVVEGGLEEQENSYFAFGETRTLEEGENDYLFTGKALDSDTGLYYYGARYYLPEIGRFISADVFTGKLAEPLSLNRYSYVENNPLKYVDPSGNLKLKPRNSVMTPAGKIERDFESVATSSEAKNAYREGLDMGEKDFKGLWKQTEDCFIEYNSQYTKMHYDSSTRVFYVGKSSELSDRSTGKLTTYGKSAAVHEVSQTLYEKKNIGENHGLRIFDKLAEGKNAGDFVEMTAGKAKEMLKAKIELEKVAYKAQRSYINSLNLDEESKKELQKQVDLDESKSVIKQYEMHLKILENEGHKDDEMVRIQITKIK